MVYIKNSLIFHLAATQRVVHHKTTADSSGNARRDNADRRVGFRDAVDVHPHDIRHGKPGVGNKNRLIKLDWFARMSVTRDSLLSSLQDPYTEPRKDTRNIAGLHLVVVVQDVQDVPPIFTIAPPLTKINNTVKPVSREFCEIRLDPTWSTFHVN